MSTNIRSTRAKVELRGLCSHELAEALDAIAMAQGLDRNAYVLQVLEAEVKYVLHRASVVTRTLKNNPLLSDVAGNNK
jgi:hypothetical protein